MEIDLSVSGTTSAISGSPTSTSTKVLSVRMLSDLPDTSRRAAVRRPDASCTSSSARAPSMALATETAIRRPISRMRTERALIPAPSSREVLTLKSPSPKSPRLLFAACRSVYLAPIGPFHRHAVFLRLAAARHRHGRQRSDVAWPHRHVRAVEIHERNAARAFHQLLARLA